MADPPDQDPFLRRDSTRDELADYDEELGDLTEEERLLAAHLGARLSGSTLNIDQSDRAGASEIADDEDLKLEALVGQATLLRASSSFERPASALASGRADVLRLASEHQKKTSAAEKERPGFLQRFWMWTPLPAVALLALVYGMRSQDSAELSRSEAATLTKARDAAPRALAESPEPARATDSTPRRLDSARVLHAQAELLSARLSGESTAAKGAALETALRSYRGQLLAQLETQR
jgi:hypothetical protein